MIRHQYFIASALIAMTMLVAPAMSAQQISDKEIEDALKLMRDSGVSEDKIEQARQSFALANASAEAAESAPVPDYEQQDQDQFDRDYANAPEATVSFKGKTYTLKVMSCTHEETWYSVDAKSAPRSKGAKFSAVKNTKPDGTSYALVNFEADGYRAGQTLDAVPFDGETYRYTGPVEVTGPEGASQAELSVTAPCQ